MYGSAGHEKRVYIYFRPPDGSRVLKSLRELDEFLEEHPQPARRGGDVCVGDEIEAEMADEEGTVREWILGVVERRLKSSFDVRFSVNNQEESGEWTENYAIKDRDREWRWPMLSRRHFAEAIANLKEACLKVIS